MYLEISSRRAGKTTRLVEAVKAHDGYSLVICANRHFAESVLRPELEAIERVKCTVGAPTKEFLREFPQYDIGARWFYDEFDFIPGVKILPNGYYATTPRFIRDNLNDKDDVLLQLIRANKGAYAAHMADFSVLSEAIIDGLPTPELGVFLRGGDVAEEAEADHIIDTYPGY